MGPSGAGKDSLIEKAKEASLAPLMIAPRLVTRKNKLKSNDIYLSEKKFKEMEQKGLLALHWSSHGLLYGIDQSLNYYLAQGLVVIVNGSREYLEKARELYPSLYSVLVTAEARILKSRLEIRAREEPEAIMERLLRTNESFNLCKENLLIIDNSGELQTAADIFIAHLKTLFCNNLGLAG
jgi:ribose 1,5-bisphosphokinase